MAKIAQLKHALHEYRLLLNGLQDAKGQIDNALDRLAYLYTQTETELAAEVSILNDQLTVKRHIIELEGEN